MTMFLDVSDDSRFFFASAGELFCQALCALNPAYEPFGFASFFPRSRAAQLEERGWCPNEARKFTSSPLSLSTRALFCQLDRRNSRPKHLHCSRKDCVESYEALQGHPYPIHRRDCHNRDTCVEIFIDQANTKKMCGMLKANHFPLLRIRTDCARVDNAVEVVPFKEQGMSRFLMSGPKV